MLPNRFVVMVQSPWQRLATQIVLLQLEDDFKGRPKFAGKNAQGVKRILFRSDPYDPLQMDDSPQQAELARVERVARALNESRLALMEIELHPDAAQRLRRYVMDLYDEAGEV